MSTASHLVESVAKVCGHGLTPSDAWANGLGHHFWNIDPRKSMVFLKVCCELLLETSEGFHLQIFLFFYGHQAEIRPFNSTTDGVTALTLH